jgi:hypothetical protein
VGISIQHTCTLANTEHIYCIGQRIQNTFWNKIRYWALALTIAKKIQSNLICMKQLVFLAVIKNWLPISLFHYFSFNYYGFN